MGQTRQTRHGATDRGAVSLKHAPAVISFIVRTRSCLIACVVCVCGATTLCSHFLVDLCLDLAISVRFVLSNVFFTLVYQIVSRLYPLVCTVARVCGCWSGPSRGPFQVGASAHTQSGLSVPSVTATVTVTVSVTGPERRRSAALRWCEHPMCWNARTVVVILLWTRLRRRTVLVQSVSFLSTLVFLF